MILLDNLTAVADELGLCLDTPKGRKDALGYLNRAQRILAQRFPEYPDFVRNVCLPIKDHCLTLPSWIERIEAAVGYCSTVPVFSASRAFLPNYAEGNADCIADCEGLEDIGAHYATIRDWTGPRRLLAYSTEPEHASRTGDCKPPEIILNGDTASRAPAHIGGGENWESGETLPIVGPGEAPSFTEHAFRAPLSSVRKTLTNGEVHLYTVRQLPDGQAVPGEWVSVLLPNETCPRYRRFRVKGVCASQLLKLRVTLRVTDQHADTEPALLSNTEALRSMAHSLHAQDTEPERALYYRKIAEQRMQDARKAFRPSGDMKTLGFKKPAGFQLRTLHR